MKKFFKLLCVPVILSMLVVCSATYVVADEPEGPLPYTIGIPFFNR